MLKIQGGDSHFWQWDVGRRLIVDDPGCSEVHFSNGTTEKAPIVDVREEDGIRVAVVPAILLQTAKPLTAFAVAMGENGSITRVAVTFPVYDRPVPDDYVCSEDEIKRWSDLDERVSKLEKGGVTGGGGGIDPEAIQEALEEYLAENPPAPGPQGPKGEKGDPGEDGKDYVLTEADKQEIAEQAAQLVEVPDSGGNAEWIPLIDVTLEEPVTSVSTDVDVNGKPFVCKDILFVAKFSKDVPLDTAYFAIGYLKANGQTGGINYVFSTKSSDAIITGLVTVVGNSIRNVVTYKGTSEYNGTAVGPYGGLLNGHDISTNEFRSITAGLTNASLNMPVGSIIKVWGR